MKKKIVTMLLIGTMALSMTACGGDKEPEKKRILRKQRLRKKNRKSK